MTSTFRLLGPLDVVVDGSSLPLGGPRQRAVLALLLIDHGHVVSVDRIQEALWPDDGRDDSRNVVQVYVSNLRKALAPVAEHLGGGPVIRTQRPGYVADLPATEIDLACFEEAADAARAAVRAGRLAEASNRFASAGALWRGNALADLRDVSVAFDGTAERLDAARHLALVDQVEVEIGLGRHAEVIEDTAALLDRDPLDERVRGLRMLALYRAGRQADALECFQEGRRALVEELGIDPGPPLRALEELILQQSPELDLDRRPEVVLGLSKLTTMFGSSVAAPRGALWLDDRRWPLDRATTTIGRRGDRTIPLEDVRASREHAEVRWAGDGYVVVDLGSTNGTSVNGSRVHHPTALGDGDVIEIGSSHLRFEAL